DVRVNNDERRTIAGFKEGVISVGELLEIICVGDFDDVPAIRLEAKGDVFAERPLRGTIKGYMIVVIDPAKIGELQVTGEGSGFAAHALHHVAVTAHRINVVIEELEAGTVVVRSQPFAGHRHADAVAATLSERASRGLDTGGDAVLGVAG